MILEMYSAYDKKVGAFMQPQFFRSRGEALRAFMDACLAKDGMFMAHPEDFGFAYMGTFDDSSGALVAPDAGPEFVMTALDAVPK